MKHLALLALLVVLLVSCGGSAPAADAPAAPAVPTAVALKDVDLDSLLVQPGDLPSGMSGAQIKDTAPAGMKDYPAATKATDQRFQKSNKTVGGVVVLLYEQQADLDKATTLAIKLSKYSEALQGVGEQGKVFLGTDLLPLRGITFVRCRAVVDISMANVETNEITAYAKRLDKRLQGVVCP